MPARSVAAVESVHCIVVLPFALAVDPFGAPSVTVIVLPLSTALDAGNAMSPVTYFLPDRTLPSASCVVFVESQTETTSGLPFVKRTTTGVAAPLHPPRTEAGATGSEKVNVRRSPVSGLPAVPPATLLVWMSTPVGAVLSTTRLATVAEVVALPATSVAMARRS